MNSGIFEKQVDNPEPHLHLEYLKKVMKCLKISSNFLNIRKIWEDRTSFEKNEDRSRVSTIPNCDEPIRDEKRPPILGKPTALDD